VTVEEIISELHELGNPENIEIKARKFGVISNNPLGIYHKELKELAKKIPKNDELAIQLFDSNIYEARLLCSKIFNPKHLTEQLIEKWVKTFENWEICDSSERKREFEKRAAFATIAAYCMADKTSDNEVFEQFFPLIQSVSTDERLYVKKAVNWALRNIGKRNKDLNKSAIESARKILSIDNKSAKWIATNALKELEKDNVRMSDYPRIIYRKN